MAREIRASSNTSRSNAVDFQPGFDTRAFPRMTYAEFLRAIPDDVHAEWVNGEVVPMTPISRSHATISRFLVNIVTHYAEAHQLGEVLFEPFQMKTGRDLPGRAPDILFVCRKNLRRLRKNYLAGPADLVVEIISPESRARDRREKFYEYERGGVREYWLIDPARKQAEFYHLDKRGVYQSMSVGEDGIFRSQVLKGFWLQVPWLWQDPLPPLLTVLKRWKLV